ncbi:MAG: hypothetical protein GDA52_07970 [Rhodobacteraceae bacterium]|nr:hypothetical protein [Paracoccaceae bacterium]
MQDDKPPGEGDKITLDDLDIAPSGADLGGGPPQDYPLAAARGSASNSLRDQTHAETTRTLNDLIKPFAEKAFWFMCAYCGAVFALLLLHGFGVVLGFSLPDSALDLLVGSTAVTVIGLVGMVLTGIFVGARR